jgi:hypothetical protein
MNTLQDLRDTLVAHAANVHNDVATARVAAVEGRARVVRRRRAAGVGAAAILAVVAASTLSMLTGDRSPVPADRQLIGKVAPATLESLGFTYHFAEGVEGGERHATIRLRPSDEPRLVTWASTANEVGILGSADGFHLRSRATDFDDFVLVEAGSSSEWSVRANGADSAIAVYELGDERPAGLTVDGMTFREQMAHQTLVDAVIGEVGDSDVTLEFTVPDGGLRIPELCRGVPDGHWVNVEIGRRGALSSGGCSEPPAVDIGGPAASAAVYADGDFEPGARLRARMWISRRVEGPPVDIPTARLGLGVYALAPPAQEAGTWDLPDRYEYAGHVWEWTGSAGGSLPGTVGGSVPDDAGLARVALDLGGDTRYRIRVDGEVVSTSSTVGESLEDLPVSGGDAISVQVLGDARGSVTIAFYSRVD